MLGCNWPDRVFVLEPHVGDSHVETVARLFAEAGLASGPQQVLKRPGALSLSTLCEDLLRMLRQDPTSGVARRPDRALWRFLLRQARLGTVNGMVAPLETVRLEVLDDEVDSDNPDEVNNQHLIQNCIQ